MMRANEHAATRTRVRAASARVPLTGAVLLAPLLALLLVAGCAATTSMPPKATDPGIGASLRVVESRMGQVFYDLGGNPLPSFEQMDARHYGLIQEELRKARHLSSVHRRSDAEQRGLAELEATFGNLRSDHREFRLNYDRMVDYHGRIDAQIKALLAMQRR